MHLYRSLSARLPKPTTQRIVILTGARQTGKTTLCRKIYPSLRYINLDAPENRDVLRQLSTPAWAQTIGNAVIDEAQKEPVVFDKVKYAFDESGVTFTVLTGSSQILLLKKIRESLAGRAFIYELWPLMQCELNANAHSGPEAKPLIHRLCSDQADGGNSIGTILSEVPGILLEADDLPYQQAEDHMLKWGGMPALLPLAEEERREWLKNYGYTYLERDVADLARLEDLMPFRKFQKLSALRSGMLLNYSELARDTGISVDTARRYLEYLGISYQAVLLQPYYRNLTSSVIKTPKLFWTDIGIWRQLTGFRGELSGQLYETMVVAEIVKWLRTWGSETGIYFYRTRSGMEVDLLLETEGGIIAIEVKSRGTVNGRDINALQTIAKNAPEAWRGGLVVYTGNKIERLAEPDIWAVPSRRLFQG